MRTLERKIYMEEPEDLPRIQLSHDGIYLMVILITVVLLSIMVGVYI